MPKKAGLNFTAFGDCLRCYQTVRESPCKIFHNRKSSRNMDKLKFTQLQKNIFLEQEQMKGWLSDH